MKLQRQLKQTFGHDAFREGQREMIDAVLSGRDALGIMPTGAGKSICFQLPALMLEGITLVISPLISLMKDQVMALKAMGVAAAYFNSSLTAWQQGEAIRRAKLGAYKIIYVAPERLTSVAFVEFARQSHISLLAVDEAHCVSQWGQDFRPSYLRIAQFIQALPQRPTVCACTATATKAVKMDIIKLLTLQNPFCLTTGYDRKNLYFSTVKPSNKLQYLLDFCTERADECGIVYCFTRNAVEEIDFALREAGLSSTRYHAGLSAQERQKNQEDFAYSRAQIMVATSAFGMGIDKSDVRYVLHFQIPMDLESYYQEAGRAGRDGEEATCVLLYAGKDYFTNKWMIEHKEESAELDELQREACIRLDKKRLSAMVEYAKTETCLRNTILHYFGEKTTAPCQNCSVCLKEAYEINNQFTYGEKTKERVRRDKSKRKTTKVHSAQQPNEEEQELFLVLRELRRLIALELHLPTYSVFSDVTLHAMATKKPKTTEELSAISGVGSVKLQRFGKAFLAILCEEKNANEAFAVFIS